MVSTVIDTMMGTRRFADAKYAKAPYSAALVCSTS